jgi:hypothetical protein
MKKIILFLMGLAMLFSLSSCVTAVHAQDDAYINDNADATVIISYGTPVYVDNMIAYYAYRGWYYYPYWINNSYYFHRYRRPLIPGTYKPMPREYRHTMTNTHRRPPHSTKPHIYHNQSPRRPSYNIGTHMNRPHNNMGGKPSGGHHRGDGLGGRR